MDKKGCHPTNLLQIQYIKTYVIKIICNKTSSQNYKQIYIIPLRNKMNKTCSKCFYSFFIVLVYNFSIQNV